MKKRILEILTFITKDRLQQKEIKMLELCIDTPEQWRILYEQVSRNKIVFFLYYHLDNNNLFYKVPAFYRKQIISYITYCSYVNNEYLTLLKKFNNIDFPYCVIKGVTLNERLYKHSLIPVQRECNDIDILVDSQNLTKMENFLMNIGFRQKYVTSRKLTREEKIKWKLTSHQIFPYRKKSNLFELCKHNFEVIDINFTIFFGGTEHDPIATEELLKNRVLYKNNREAISFYTLNICDELLQLCVNVYKDTIYNEKKEKRKAFCIINILDIKKYIDIYFSDFYVDKFVELVERHEELRDFICLPLRLVYFLYGGKAGLILHKLNINFCQDEMKNFIEEYLIS